MIKPLTIILAGVTLATSVFAAQPAPSTSDTPLRGPEVTPKETQPPHRDRPGARPGAEFPRGHMFKAMHQAFSKLASPEAPDELRLTEDQAKKLAGLRAEMRERFESGERPMRQHRPMAKAMDILNEDQKAFIKETVRESMKDIRGEVEGRRGQLQRGPRMERDFENRPGPRGMRGEREQTGNVSTEQRVMMKQFRQLSPEAKQRVREFIEQEYKLQQRRKAASEADKHENATP